MANQIWKWENNQPPEYKTNPNICIALEKPIFASAYATIIVYSVPKFFRIFSTPRTLLI